MNSAKSFITVKQKIESSLKRHWASSVRDWNTTAPIPGSMAVLPLPELWEINVGTIDGKNVDVTPTLQVSIGTSTFRLLTTCQREESFRVSVVTTIPDSERGTPHSLDRAQIAARLAAEILEKNSVDSPGDLNGTTYRVDFINTTPLELSPTNQRGAACRLEMNYVCISNYEYQPDVIVTAVSPVSYSANRADGIGVEYFLASLPVDTLGPITSGSVAVDSQANFDEIVVTVTSVMTPLAITNAYAFTTDYLLASQPLTVIVSAGAATIQVPAFAGLNPGDVYSIRVWAWDTVTGNDTFFTLNITKV